MKIQYLIILITLSNFVFGQKTKIYTEDINNFWIAFDSIKTTKDTSKQIKIIQEIYLNKASDGLKDFMVLREHSAELHLFNILTYPNFWNSLRPHTLELNSNSKEIEFLFKEFKTSYPNFKQPEVYFTIGVLNSGGTTTKDKILIGSEIACSDKTVDASELGSWLEGVFKDNKNVIYLVIHESVHTQQKIYDNDTNQIINLLGNSIMEGSCDFITELLMKKDVVSPYMTFGKANEHEIWENFKKEMLGQETINWLYNGDNAPNGHADLGYFVGYAICKSYYENSKNKKKAIKQIIELDYSPKSVLKFLKKSKYNGRQKSNYS